VLNNLRKVAPEIEVRYSLEQPYQWQRFLRIMEKHASVRRVCISHRFIDSEKARVMEETGVDLYVWTVDDRPLADRLVSDGVDGIISNDLGLLESLPRR
jgi:glycerophosphoryl diester phosphodiesterase